MDLGIIVPVAVATGVGLLRGSRAAVAASYGVCGVFALIGASVTSMAVIMQLNDDPAASPALIAGFGVITAAFAALAVRLVRSAMPPRRVHTRRPASVAQGRS